MILKKKDSESYTGDDGHQILLWCRHSISNEIQVMYNALYLIHFTVAEANWSFVEVVVEVMLKLTLK